MAGDGPLPLSRSGQQDLAEITSPGFPGERLAACRNPVLAAGRARKREDLLAATEKLPAPLIARVTSGRLAGAGPTGVEAGKVIATGKTAKHFTLTITGTSLTMERRQDQIDAEAALDGFHVLRTPIPARERDAPTVVTAGKNLTYAGRDFRHIRSDDLDLRPVSRRLEELRGTLMSVKGSTGPAAASRPGSCCIRRSWCSCRGDQGPAREAFDALSRVSRQ
jgi:hypothetical protein